MKSHNKTQSSMESMTLHQLQLFKLDRKSLSKYKLPANLHHRRKRNNCNCAILGHSKNAANVT